MSNRILPITLIALAAFAATACNVSIDFGDDDDITGSGTLVTETYDFDDFDRINIGSAFDADITVGPAESLSITADDNAVEHLIVEVNGDTLDIKFERGFRNGTLQATVTLPDLVELEASGATDVIVRGVNNDGLTLAVSGASDVTVTGETSSLGLEASGASDVDLDGLTVADVSADISGSSDIQLRAAGSISGELSGSSDLFVNNDTTVELDITGSSEVHRS